MNIDEIVLVTHADTDHGFTIARELLARGHRVVVTATHPTTLSRILLGQNANQVMAIAADIEDEAQRIGILSRAHVRFATPVTRIVDGRGPMSHRLKIAS